MAYEIVKRNRFYNPDSGQIVSHASRNHYEDLHDFHIPLERMHNSNLHDWGIARGLEVNGTIGGTEIIVNPGVAIDSDGQLISLSNEGHGDIGANPPEGESNEVDVPVHLSTQNNAGQTVCVTIQYSEILRTNEGVLGRLEQVPWVRLQQVQPNNTLDSKSIVLAIAVMDTEGKLSELKSADGALSRRLIGETIEELQIQRPIKDGDKVQHILSGRIGPGEGGGLKITVPDTQDSILFAREDGDEFESLGILAKVGIGNTNPSAKLEVNGDIKGNANLAINGNVGIGTTEPQSALEVSKTDTDAVIKAQTMNSGNSSLSLFNNGNQEYQIVANRASNCLEITSPGTIGAMMIFDPNRGNVGIGTDKPDGKLDVKGDIRAGNSDIYFTKADHNHTGIGNTSGYAAIENAANYNALMILGRAGTTKGRYVRLWDYLQVNGGLDVTGNVGIGTDSPGGKLDVRGDIRAGNSDIYFTKVDHNHTGIGNTAGFAAIENASNFGALMILGRAGTTKGRYVRLWDYLQVNGGMDVTGNVGIGITTPRTPLHVLGRISTGADFTSAGAITFFPPDGFAWFHIDNGPAGGRPMGRLRISHGNQPGTIELMSILQSGNIGIGTPNPGAKLDVAGVVRAASFIPSSDARLKSDIKPLTDVLDKLEKIRGVSFKWNELDPYGRSEGGREIGLIAQEVEEVFPELITTCGDEGYRGIDYNRFTSVLLQAIKELKAENEVFKVKIKALEDAVSKHRDV